MGFKETITCVTDCLENSCVLNYFNNVGCQCCSENRCLVFGILKIFPAFIQLGLICFLMTGLSSVPSVISDSYWFRYESNSALIFPDLGIPGWQIAFPGFKGNIDTNTWGYLVDVAWFDGVATATCGSTSSTVGSNCTAGTTCSSDQTFLAKDLPLWKACGPCTDYPSCRSGDRTCDLETFSKAFQSNIEQLITALTLLANNPCFYSSFVYANSLNGNAINEAELKERIQTSVRTAAADYRSDADTCQSAVSNIQNFLWISFIFGILGSVANLFSPRLTKPKDVGYQKFIGMWLAGPLPALFNMIFILTYKTDCYNDIHYGGSNQFGPGFDCAITFTLLAIPITISDWIVPVPCKTDDVEIELQGSVGVDGPVEVTTEGRV